MKDLLLIASGAGLRDGLNPCMFMACAVFLAYGHWLKKSSLQFFWMFIVFAFVYGTSFLVFEFGPAQLFILKRSFSFAAKVIYFLLSIGAFSFGVLFFKDWIILRRTESKENLSEEKIKSFAAHGIVIYLTVILLAVDLSALATLWPINRYVLLLGVESLLRNQWRTLATLLLGYVLVCMWPLWTVWAFLSIKNLRPALLKIVYAAIFFTASSCIVLIFRKL